MYVFGDKYLGGVLFDKLFLFLEYKNKFWYIGFYLRCLGKNKLDKWFIGGG